MKELFILIFSFRMVDLLMRPTENTTIQFFRYVFVGGFAFVIDASVLYVVEFLGVHYLIATAIAFLFGLVANFILSKKFVFTEKPVVKRRESEFIIYGLIGIIGLVITEGFMYLLTDIRGFYFMLSKVLVAIIVLIWNYCGRKIILYQN